MVEIEPKIGTQIDINWSFGEAFRGFADSLKTLGISIGQGLIGISSDAAMVLFIMIATLAAGYVIYRRLR